MFAGYAAAEINIGNENPAFPIATVVTNTGTHMSCGVVTSEHNHIEKMALHWLQAFPDFQL